MKYPVILTDLARNTVLFEGLAQVEQTGRKGVSIAMQNESVNCTWQVFPKGCLITNKEEMDVSVRILANGKGKVTIDSGMGILEMNLQNAKLDTAPDSVSVFYKLEEEGEQFAFRLSGLQNFGPIFQLYLFEKEEEA